MEQYVIIGNGTAAVGCIEGIRSIDKEGKITVISGENHECYCRPLISYYLEGKTDTEKMKYRKDGFYEENGCEVIYAKAKKIDTASKKVVLDNGKEVAYTKLCTACGSTAFVPPMEGLDKVEKKFTFMTLDDTLALEQAVNAQSRVLIVGAGLIGLKCAEGLKNRVMNITVCDLADRVLSSILDADCAAFVQRHLEENGIRFLLGTSVKSFDAGTAAMTSGDTVDFDVLVLAVGVRANTSLIKDAGGAVNRGIIVEDDMTTSLENIYAAGDCAEGNDISLGEKRVLALLPNAYMQGECAGVNMAGGEKVFDKAIPMNAIGFFGLHMMTAGVYCDEAAGGTVYEEKTDTSVKRLFIKDDRLMGFILIGTDERAGIYTSLIREKTPLSSVDLEMIKKIATTAAFSSENRRKMFGGVV